MRATREMQSAKFAVMYDREAIYLGAEVTDPTPLRNRHAPEAEGDKAWDADSCQFRIITDASVGYPANFGSFQESDPGNGRLAQAILWCFTDRQEPNLQLETGMQGQLPPASMRFGVSPARAVPGGLPPERRPSRLHVRVSHPLGRFSASSRRRKAGDLAGRHGAVQLEPAGRPEDRPAARRGATTS